MSLSADNLIEFLTSELGIEGPIDPQTELFSGGFLDSVSMVNLIGFIEQKTGETVQPADVTLENFDSVNQIIAYCKTLG